MKNISIESLGGKKLCLWSEENCAFTENSLYIYIVAYLLKARTVGTEKQPLLGNGRTQQYSRCYVAPASYACKVTSRNTRRGAASDILCGSAPRLYDSTDRVQFSE
jgi:hypothetical protein